VPDNDKSAVTKADRYEPDINKTYNEMAQHYGVAILPARVRKPKDKPKVESTVGNIETWIMAALRNEVFYSFAELNRAILQKLTEYSDKPFQKKEDSRRIEFLTYDLPAMQVKLIPIAIQCFLANFRNVSGVLDSEKIHFSFCLLVRCFSLF